MLGMGWRLVCWVPLFVAMASNADSCSQPSALQRYDVEDLRIFDIYRDSHSRAFSVSIADPGGYTYQVKVGEYLTKDSGRVDKITSCPVFSRKSGLTGKTAGSK